MISVDRSLQWLRGPNKNVELELETIRSNIQSTKTRTNIFPTITLGNLMTMTSVRAIYTKVKSILKNVRIIKPLSITCGLMVFQRFTGTYEFTFYSRFWRTTQLSSPLLNQRSQAPIRLASMRSTFFARLLPAWIRMAGPLLSDSYNCWQRCCPVC